MDELTRNIAFQVFEAEEGGYYAKAVGLGIITEGDDLADLRRMIEDAIRGYFFDDPTPPQTYSLIFEQLPVPAAQ
jgi:hypothetical protein